MTAPAIHSGSGFLNAPEMLIRQVLLEGLQELAGDQPRQRELFARPDDLEQGSQEEWVEDAMAFLLSLSTPGAGGWNVGIGYPPDTMQLPYASIVIDNAAEQPGGATVGDILHTDLERTGQGSSLVLTRHVVKGVDYASNIQVGCWCTSPEGASILLSIVRHLLFRHKGRMTAAGIHDISTSESGFAPDPALYPRTGYVPVIKVSLDWTLRQTVRTSPVPLRARLRNTTIIL